MKFIFLIPLLISNLIFAEVNSSIDASDLTEEGIQQTLDGGILIVLKEGTVWGSYPIFSCNRDHVEYMAENFIQDGKKIENTDITINNTQLTREILFEDVRNSRMPILIDNKGIKHWRLKWKIDPPEPLKAAWEVIDPTAVYTLFAGAVIDGARQPFLETLSRNYDELPNKQKFKFLRLAGWVTVGLVAYGVGKELGASEIPYSISKRSLSLVEGQRDYIKDNCTIIENADFVNIAENVLNLSKNIDPNINP